MNKYNMSLGEYCKRRNIPEENIYTASKEDPTDWPKVYRHEDEIIIDEEYAKQMNEECKLDELMQEIIACARIKEA